MRAIRGAITVNENNIKNIREAVKLLISKLIKKNNIKSKEIVSIIFTATSDLDKMYPAKVVREMGYDEIPLMCYQEMQVVDSLAKCIRVIVYLDRHQSHSDFVHVYLRKAKNLRPDLYNGGIK